MLARGQIGGPDPRPVTDRVKDAAWLPGGELAILRQVCDAWGPGHDG